MFNDQKRWLWLAAWFVLASLVFGLAFIVYPHSLAVAKIIVAPGVVILVLFLLALILKRHP